jgi:pilus assembly protein CpaE
MFLVVDLTGTAAPLGAVNALADVCTPDTRVVAVGTVNDVALYRGLRALGVIDYLVKPLDQALLAQAFDLALGAGPAPALTPQTGSLSVAFMGARGGAGTTSLAIAAAQRLAATPGRRVVLYDHDLQAGTVALDLDGKAGEGLATMLEAPDRVDRTLVETALEPHPLGFSLLAAEEPADRLLAVKPEAAMALLSTLEAFADATLIDLPRRLDRSGRAILRIVDRVVIVAPRTLAGLRDSRRLAAAVTGLRAGQRPIIVANRVGGPGPDLGAGLFEEGLGQPVALAIPEDSRAAARAASRSTALGAGETDTPLARALDRLVRLIDPASPPPPPRRMAGWLRNWLPR